MPSICLIMYVFIALWYNCNCNVEGAQNQSHFEHQDASLRRTIGISDWKGQNHIPWYWQSSERHH